MYDLIAFGANRAPGSRPLQFAEKDAADVVNVFTSPLGPVSAGSHCLGVGTSATSSALRSALSTARARRPDQLVFYFSGHGSPAGIALSDGLFSFRELIRRLRAVAAPASLVILDVCHAGALRLHEQRGDLGGLETLTEAWATALARATPGNRLMLSSAASQRSHEGQVPNGHFTHCLLRALKEQSGDIDADSVRFISDRQAYRRAARLLGEFRGLSQRAEAHRLSGDFPMIVSEQDVQVGHARFESGWARRDGLGVSASVMIEGRARLDTYVRATLIDRRGNAVWIDRGCLRAESDRASYRVEFSLRPSELLADPGLLATWSDAQVNGHCWEVACEDQAGDEISRFVIAA